MPSNQKAAFGMIILPYSRAPIDRYTMRCPESAATR